MFEQKSFTFRLVVLLGFFYVFYMFFVLATSVYQNYRFRSEVKSIEKEVADLRQTHKASPQDIAYFNSPQFKTLYAKESLGRYIPGEKILALKASSPLVKQGEAQLLTDNLSPSSVLQRPYPTQWKEYFFGQTLSLR